jgi:hypothetical protein
MVDAVDLITQHLKVPTEKNVAASIPCGFADCIHHENVPKEIGLAILKLHGDPKPWRDNRGIPVGMAPISASQDDKPPGFDIGKDAAHRSQGEDPIAAEVYVRFARRATTAHLWVTPSFSSRHEDALEAVGVWDLKRIYEENIKGYREWVMAKWTDMKNLAEMELSAEKPAVEPERKRPRKKKI